MIKIINTRSWGFLAGIRLRRGPFGQLCVISAKENQQTKEATTKQRSNNQPTDKQTNKQTNSQRDRQTYMGRQSSEDRAPQLQRSRVSRVPGVPCLCCPVCWMQMHPDPKARVRVRVRVRARASPAPAHVWSWAADLEMVVRRWCSRHIGCITVPESRCSWLFFSLPRVSLGQSS